MSSLDGAEERLEREREFHNERFSTDDRGASKYYAVAGATFDDYRRRVRDLPPHSAVLEYGCGTGGLAFEMAEAGHDVIAIDLSPVAVEAATESAGERGIAGCRFVEMNAEDLEFADQSLDLVFGSGILHHLDLERSLSEVARVLRPGGSAVFMEPLGKNPMINLYRRFTPGMRTPDEHPLVESDLPVIEAWFDQVDLAFFQLSTLAAAPLTRFDFSVRLVSRLGRIDGALFRRFPRLRWQAWNVVLHLRNPRTSRRP